MSPPYFHQAYVWIELIKKFEWSSVNLIHSYDDEGKMFASKFQDLADLYNIKVSYLFKKIYLKTLYKYIFFIVSIKFK